MLLVDTISMSFPLADLRPIAAMDAAEARFSARASLHRRLFRLQRPPRTPKTIKNGLDTHSQKSVWATTISSHAKGCWALWLIRQWHGLDWAPGALSSLLWSADVSSTIAALESTMTEARTAHGVWRRQPRQRLEVLSWKLRRQPGHEAHMCSSVVAN